VYSLGLHVALEWGGLQHSENLRTLILTARCTQHSSNRL